MTKSEYPDSGLCKPYFKSDFVFYVPNPILISRETKKCILIEG